MTTNDVLTDTEKQADAIVVRGDNTPEDTAATKRIFADAANWRKLKELKVDEGFAVECSLRDISGKYSIRAIEIILQQAIKRIESEAERG